MADTGDTSGCVDGHGERARAAIEQLVRDPAGYFAAARKESRVQAQRDVERGLREAARRRDVRRRRWVV